MLEQEWRPVGGYEGLYEVSDTGQVRRIPRSQAYPQPRRVLKATVGTTGYPYVTLYRAGAARKFKVHRLVAAAFLPRPDGDVEVCHEDGDRLNARADNLRWDTRSANVRDAVRHGTHKNQFRDRDHCSNNHPYTDENTLLAPDGRKCRTCRRERVRAWRARQKATVAA